MPPSTPQGGNLDLPAETVRLASLQRTLYSLTAPKPPLNLPWPVPSSVFRAYLSTSIGVLLSYTSLDAMYVSPSPQATRALSPSWSQPAPHPPGWGSTMAKGSPVLSSTPPSIVASIDRKWPALSLSGAWGASAFHTMSAAWDIPSQNVEVGAGLTGLKTVPSGAIILMGLKKPPLGWVYGSISAM